MTITADRLGAPEFMEDHRLCNAYVAGSMVRGISSVNMVVNMARAGFLGFFGTGALGLAEIEAAIRDIQAALPDGQRYGMNLLSNAASLEAEMATVDLILKYGVPRVEASAYMQVTAPLVKYRLRGLRAGPGGRVVAGNMILAKLSRPEVAALFLAPPPENIVAQLLRDGKVTADQAALARSVPLADDICVEADSGGHTDRAVLSTVLPTIIRQRDAAMAEHGFAKRVRIGGAGGIGTPEAAASTFILGADFILTGSINQCTVEAGTSDAAKDLLQQLNVQGTDYAPSGSLFELGAKTQVVKQGVFFPARANKLHELWRLHGALEEIDVKTRQQIEEKYFRRSFEDVYAETRDYYLRTAPAEIEKAERNPRHKMALVFRWYFVHTMRLAVTGSPEQKVDYQIHCGSAMGAFNQLVKGTSLEDWRRRRVADIGRLLMDETAALLDKRMRALTRVSGPFASAPA